ncbi:MAG: hypothetical protein A2283_02370 [Lentisphaerae bacterium RIFOXYA12_FULL_48_11]|nr:MAG: hypothetical protein A2283_02370 [Lentisphaerae bacterium RIFOXYA12_FULL_48_11]
MNTHEQTKHERAAENMRRMATVVRDSNDAILVQDFEGRITAWNHGAELMYGYSEEEALQMNIGCLTPPDKEAEQQEFTSRLLAGEAISSFETQRLTQDGRILDVWLTVTKLVDDAGKPIGIASTERDITGRKLGEVALRKTNRELQVALHKLQKNQAQMVREERLSALGQMASGIVHDFNNVLMPIVGYSEMLLSNPSILSKSEEALSMIMDINTAAEDARRIVQRLKLIQGSDDKGECVSLDVNEIARSAVELARPRWDKEMGAKGNRIHIVTLLGADKQTLGDASQLREALINLILNAVDAMPNGGTLTLSSRVENSNVIVEILDEGIGMTDETKDRCLEPFFTTKGIKGTGLGLSMVHGIVTRHNGTMEIDSTLGKGTTIRIVLPHVSAEHLAKESKVEEIGKGFTIVPLRILVADDEEQSRMLIAKLLIRDGHTITMARTGREAIDQASAGTFDLVITDRAMPDVNGDVVALSVKARTREIPVILLTGFGDIMKEQGECPPGVDRVLSKPLTQQDLRQAIAGIMVGKDS